MQSQFNLLSSVNTGPPGSWRPIRAKAAVLRAQGNWEEAAAILRRLIDLHPLEANRHSDLDICLLDLGHPQEALESLRRARQLGAGNDPIYIYDALIATAYVANDQLPEAIAEARLAIPEFPPGTGRIAEYAWLALIAAESDSGQEAAAEMDLQRFLASPGVLHSMTQIQRIPTFAANPKLMEGLRRAGMPEQ